VDAVDASQRKPYSIGHVSDVTGVNASTLRSWEQQGLIEPAKSVGGRRTFTDEDIQRTLEGFRATKKKLDAGEYKVQAIPDMAEA